MAGAQPVVIWERLRCTALPIPEEPTATLLLALLLASSALSTTAAADKGDDTSTLRWAEGEPGCTFSRDDDGKYRYGFWTDDYGVVLAVDSQELEKARRRPDPIFALQLTIHYRGKDSLDVIPDQNRPGIRKALPRPAERARP